MSITFETYCEDYESLFDEVPHLRKDQVTTGSDNMHMLLYPHEFSDHYESDYANFFEYLEQQFGLKDPIFTNLIEEEKTEAEAGEVIEYLSQLLKILEERKDDLPSLYSFREEETGELYLETTVGKIRLQGGYDHCIAIEGETVVDLREQESYTAEDKDFSIVRESIAEAFGKDFLAMLEVAKTAQRYGRCFVATVY